MRVRHKAVERIARFGSAKVLVFADLRGGLDRLAQWIGLNVTQGHALALDRGDGGNFCAHGTRTDDVDMRDAVIAAPGVLKRLLEEENTTQVLRGVRIEKPREAVDLGLLHRIAIVAMLFPQVDQGVGRRVMLFRGFLFCLASHLAGGEAARLVELRTQLDALDAPPDALVWSSILALATVVLLVVGRYRLIQTVSTALVGLFTLTTVITVLMLQREPDFAITGEELLSGLSFRLPEPVEGVSRAPLATALAAFDQLGLDPPGVGPERAATLSAREVEVLAVVAEGLTNQQVAGRLHLSPHTVARHLGNIFAKLGVNTRTAAVTAAVRQGWLPAPHGQS